MKILDCISRYDFRKWLEDNHDTACECWLVVKRGKSESSQLRYIDAVEEALCFGWIDSIRKTISNGITAQRFTPRRHGSRWSELNKERCRRLERLGMMTDARLKVLPDMSESSFKIDRDILTALQEDLGTWENFLRFPELYRRVRVDTIQRDRRDTEIFCRRLARLVENTKAGKMFGEWNDNGRL
ncbi:MAG: YdeI/OmpD-associated family protein [Synergistaceae bacterium]|nr:YdeI/OmpD-associated family protein [Synergistaceae bacterium]MBQ7168718.1 YdeI/OmpD-associated family protein [Synergistaceae bacterium]